MSNAILASAAELNEIMPKVIVGVIGVFFVIFLVVFLRIFLSGRALDRQIRAQWEKTQRQLEEARRCPRCEKPDAMLLAAKKELSRDTITRTEARMAQQFDALGRLVGSTQQHVPVQVVRVTSENRHRCKFCDHEFTAVETEEIDG
jgi:hypothetical protein